MDVFLLLVLSAAFIALLWHAGRWAFRNDRKTKHRKRRVKKRDRVKQELIDAEFEEIIKSARKKRDG